MYHATMPTDALVQVRAALFATRDFGFEKVGHVGVQAHAHIMLQYSTATTRERIVSCATWAALTFLLFFHFRPRKLSRSLVRVSGRCWRAGALLALLQRAFR